MHRSARRRFHVHRGRRTRFRPRPDRPARRRCPGGRESQLSPERRLYDLPLECGSTRGEIPLLIGASERADVAALGGNAEIYTEEPRAFATPGIRLRIAPQRRLSPWVAFGAGISSLRRTGVSYTFLLQPAFQEDTNLTAALAPAASLDWNLSERWFVRGEMRHYLYRTSATGFVASWTFQKRWNHNPVFLGGPGLRF